MGWPLIAAAAIGAGASFLGGERANRANAAQSARQMDFQERLSNTSYQRAVQDIRAAGLNPMLAYQQGGASTPSGAQAQMENTGAAAVSGASAAAQQFTNFSAQQSQQKLNLSTEQYQAAKAWESQQQAMVLGHMPNKIIAGAENLRADTALKAIQEDNIRGQTSLFSAQAALAHAEKLATDSGIRWGALGQGSQFIRGTGDRVKDHTDKWFGNNSPLWRKK
jgi:hypothetical protein